MKRLMIAAGTVLTMLLTGCATTIRSDVTTFHQWPAQIEDKSYVFEAPPVADDTLEYRAYQDLVRGQLARLGFRDAAGGKPALTVSMRFTTTEVPVRVIEPITPFAHPFAHPFYRPYYHPARRFGYRGLHRPYWGGFYSSPFYDPFWSPAYHVSVENRYRRELQVGIKSASDGKRLFDVTVHNMSRELSTPALMPALVQSAFEGFPGPSGVARRVELKQQNG